MLSVVKKTVIAAATLLPVAAFANDPGAAQAITMNMPAIDTASIGKYLSFGLAGLAAVGAAKVAPNAVMWLWSHVNSMIKR